MIEKIEDIILSHIINEYGEKASGERVTHYSYCLFPEQLCTCKDLNEITYNTQLITGGYMDSFSMVAVLVFLEKTFNVKIPDVEASPDNFNTVAKMTALVKRHQK